MRGLAVALVVLAACGPASRRPPELVPTIDETAPAQPPPVLAGWTAVGKPIRFVPIGSPTLQALLVERDVVNRREVMLVTARLDGEALATTPLAEVVVGGASRRDVVTSLTRFQASALRVEISIFELTPPRRFAVKMLLIEVVAGKPRIILDRLVESGDDARDRRATLVARDVDGDGVPELVIDERESGTRRRTLVYRRNRDGVYETRDPSLFTD